MVEARLKVLLVALSCLHRTVSMTQLLLADLLW
jgi:hypothetical protein